MIFLKNILLSIYKKPSLYLFIFLIIFSIDRYSRWVDFNKNDFPFLEDVNQFYSYLPASVIHQDLTFSYPNNYWTSTAPNGTKIARTTFGMAVMYSPFFFIAHFIAKQGNYEASGYSLPYKWSIHFGSILYALLGLWFCRKNLLLFFDEYVTSISLISVFLGTNLFYYTYGLGEMSHSYLFFIISVFIYITLKWHRTQKLKYFLLLSFIAGFATLIRPTDCVVLLFPCLLGVKTLTDFKTRLKLFIKSKSHLILALSLFILPFFTQMLYWKIYADRWLYFSYGNEEGFFFSDPQIINFLFSFRKGWFIYTPIMFFILFGIPLLKKTGAVFFNFMIVYFLVNVYILSSWWDWGFGGSFGCRAIIQHYAFFIFALASFVSFIFQLSKKKMVAYFLKTFLCLSLLSLIIFNYNQSWLYKYGIIHYNGMTKEAYFYIFNRKELSKDELKELQTKIRPPDIQAMLKGERD